VDKGLSIIAIEFMIVCLCGYARTFFLSVIPSRSGGTGHTDSCYQWRTGFSQWSWIKVQCPAKALQYTAQTVNKHSVE